MAKPYLSFYLIIYYTVKSVFRARERLTPQKYRKLWASG